MTRTRTALRALQLIVLAALTSPAPAKAWVAQPATAFVSLSACERPGCRASAGAVAAYAAHRAGVSGEKVLGPVEVRTPDDLVDVFAPGGELSLRLDRDDTLIVYVVADTKDGRVSTPGGPIDPSVLANLGPMLRSRLLGDTDPFLGRIVLFVDAPGLDAEPLRQALAEVQREVVVLLDRSKGPAESLAVASLEPTGPTLDRRALAALALLPGDAPSHLTRGCALWLATMDVLGESGLPSISVEAWTAAALGLSRELDPTLLVAAAHLEADFAVGQPRASLLLTELVPRQQTKKLLGKAAAALREALGATASTVDVLEEPSAGNPTVTCRFASAAGKVVMTCQSGSTDVTTDTVSFDEAELGPRMAAFAANLAGSAPAASGEASVSRKLPDESHVVLLLDASRSMAYHDPTQATDPTVDTRITKREVVVHRVVDALKARADRTGVPCRLAVARFHRDVRFASFATGTFARVDGGFTDGDRDSLLSQVRELLRPGAATNLIGALSAARQQLSNAGAKAGACHVVLLTDGTDSVWEPPSEAPERLRDEAESLRRMGCRVHTVGLSEADGRLPDYLRRLSEGGELLRRYLDYVPDIAPWPGCEGAEIGAESGRRCGAIHAGAIRIAGRYDAALLDAVRRDSVGRGLDGVMLELRSVDDFQRELQKLTSAVAEEGSIGTRPSTRRPGSVQGEVVDTWDIPAHGGGSMDVVFYNRDGLTDLRWRVLDGERPVDPAAVSIREEGDALAVVQLRGIVHDGLRVERTGRRRQ